MSKTFFPLLTALFVMGLFVLPLVIAEEWITFQADLQNTGYTNNTAPNNISILHAKYITNAEVEGSPCVSDEYVYVGGGDNKIYQFSKDNVSNLIATFSIGDWIYNSGCTFDENYIYIGAEDDKFYQLDKNNISNMIASYQTGGDVDASPKIWGDYIYIGSYDGNLYQFNKSNISNPIRNFTADGVIKGAIAIKDGYIFLTGNSMLYKLNATNLSLINNVSFGGNTHASPAVKNGYVYFGQGNILYQVNESNITQNISRFDMGANARSYGPPAVTSEYVYVGSYNGNNFFQLNASNISQKIANISINTWNSPIATDDYVFISGTDGKIYQVNANNVSQIINIFTTGNAIYGAMALADGFLYVGSDDNSFYQLGEGIPPQHFFDINGTIVCDNASIGEWGVVNGINYTKVDETILRSMNPNTDNFSIVCTSGITNMNSLFLEASSFNQDISTWDTSSVTNMASMFEGASSFNQPIGNWDVSKVKWMTNMFYGAESFNQPIGNWDTFTVQYMGGMFAHATSFNQPIGNWDTSNVRLMSNMFEGASSFNQPIGSWDTSNVEDMSYMFNEASAFNQNISGWDTSSVTNMEYMFYNSPFNQPIGNWDTSSVTNMQGMFAYAYNFNQPIGNWNTSNVLNMQSMFEGASAFNQNISGWDTSKVTTMASMFAFTSFNQPIENWDTSNVQDMSFMFRSSSFNQPIENWDVSNVQDMSFMFAQSSFNQDIGNWNTSSVENMNYMFFLSSFNQPIGSWDTSNVKYMGNMFDSASNFNQSIGDWNVSNVENMDYMFYYATSFNQDLTSWCVINIPTEPVMFSTGSPLTENHKPIWGTCGGYKISFSNPVLGRVFSINDLVNINWSCEPESVCSSLVWNLSWINSSNGQGDIVSNLSLTFYEWNASVLSSGNYTINIKTSGVEVNSSEFVIDNIVPGSFDRPVSGNYYEDFLINWTAATNGIGISSYIVEVELPGQTVFQENPNTTWYTAQSPQDFNESHPFTHAFDGNYSTYAEKNLSSAFWSLNGYFNYSVPADAVNAIWTVASGSGQINKTFDGNRASCLQRAFTDGYLLIKCNWQPDTEVSCYCYNGVSPWWSFVAVSKPFYEEGVYWELSSGTHWEEVVNTTDLNTTYDPQEEVLNTRFRLSATDDYITTPYVYSSYVNISLEIINWTCPSTTPIANSTVAFNVTFNVVVPQGASAIVDTQVNLSYGNNTYQSTACTYQNITSQTRQYTCTIPFQYYYDPGNYDITVYAATSGASSRKTQSALCTYNVLTATARDKDYVTFSSQYIGLSNITVDAPIRISNLGNDDISVATLTAFDLSGLIIPSQKLLASYFRAGANLSSSEPLDNNVPVNITFTLTHGADSYLDFYLWVSAPDSLYPQAYVATTPWQLLLS